jgi:cytochrome c peroxidase
MRQLIQIATILLTAVAAPALAELPAVPVPPENPITEAKRVLGKILFWDEQLSSDDTVACGTCHLPAAGGADPRAAVHPGAVPGSVDDVAGSPGIRRLDNQGRPVEDPVFGSNPQVTPRTAPSVFGALWANELFWDGRAGGKLIDPGTGETVIAAGAALENQALATLLNDAEMAKEGRTWQELNVKLERVGPLALADQWPADVKEAIASRPTYPELFRAAFGDSAITATRIVMAIATYQRTLVPDQSPWDLYLPPLFTNNDFINIGLRRSEYDAGRAGVTENPEDAGDMKVPSLRNIGLRSRFMHTGEFRTLGEAINFYRNGASLPEVDEIPDAGAYTFSLSLQTAADMQSFLANALTDPRVATETFPFDRPRLASER